MIYIYIYIYKVHIVDLAGGACSPVHVLVSQCTCGSICMQLCPLTKNPECLSCQAFDSKETNLLNN